jgi:hypothetical protein
LRRRLESLGSTYTFHRAVTVAGEAVVLKVMRSGIRNSIETDLRLLGMLGNLLQRLIPRYQPKRIVVEFSAYTAREVDFTVEADNAETFAANFADMPAVRVGGTLRENGGWGAVIAGLSTCAVTDRESAGRPEVGGSGGMSGKDRPIRSPCSRNALAPQRSPSGVSVSSEPSVSRCCRSS